MPVHGRSPALSPSPLAGGTRDSAASGDGVDLDQLLRLLWRRKGLILGVAAAILLAAGLVVAALPERYRAVAVLLFDAPSPGTPGLAGGAEPLDREGRLLASEIEVLQSRSLLDAVVSAEELLFEPEFNPTLTAGGGLLHRLGLAAPPKPAELRLSRQRARTRGRLRTALQVAAVGRSRAVEIAVTSRDPALAARLANAVARTYLARESAKARRRTGVRTAWLDARVGELRSRVQAADKAVAEYRLSTGLLAGRTAGVNAQRIAQLNSALIAAGQVRSDAEARLQQVERLVERGGTASAAEVLDSHLIQSLVRAESDLLRRRADLATTYGLRHPRMRTVNAELIDLRRKIELEVAKIVDNLRNEAAVARRRERDLRAELAAAEREAGRLSRAEVELDQLEREAAAEQALFDTFLARLKETGVAKDPPRPHAEVIGAAEPPLAPAAPNRALLMGLAAMLAGTAGIGLAFAAEALDRGVRGLADLEGVTRRPGLALVPRVRLRRGETPSLAALRRPNSAYAESLRSLHTALTLSGQTGPVRAVMLTSALPGEGKTSLACALARVLAMGGRRVLLIDADLRHPRVAAEIGIAAGPGLVELLAGTADAAAAVRPDPAAQTGGRLDVVAAGQGGDVAALHDSRRLVELIDRCTPHYDLVLLDAPPVLAVADPRALGHRIDRTVMVVRWAHTPRNTVQQAVRQLEAAGADLAGAVLTQVDLRRQAQYGTGDTGGFAASVAGYYGR